MNIKFIKFITIITIILVGFSVAQNSKAAINKQFNYQGKLTNTSGVAVADGAYDIVFKLYTVGGEGSASWTESWTNAALWTETSATTVDKGHADCGGAGYTKITYVTVANESTLVAEQTVWNTTKKESAVIKSVTPASDYFCIYNSYTDWISTDDLTNRIYVKDGLFSAMVGTITTQTVDFTAATYYLGVTIGADAEMIPRKRIGAVPQAWNANNVVGDGRIGLDYNSNSSTALTVAQSGTGDIVNIFDGSTEVFTILDGGNVGIGTTTPVSTLDVRGTIENGLVAWWPMDEGTGTTVVDKSISAKDGTITNSSCPTGYILVPGNATYSTSDFCVMQYEAKNVGGVATSQAGSTPWVSITQTAAATACSSAGGHLITNNEWMTIARNAEQVASNWTLGSVGSGYLFAGHNDNVPAAAKAASATNTGDYRCAYTDTAGTTENPTPCPTNTAAGASGTAGNQVRVLTLSNGETIWDLSGNVWEWTNNTISCAAAQCTTDEMPYDATPASEWIEFTAINTYGQLSYDQIRPSNAAWNATQGMGRLYTDFDAAYPSGNVHAFLRGGDWDVGASAGAFALALDNSPANSSSNIGFRCSR